MFLEDACLSLVLSATHSAQVFCLSVLDSLSGSRTKEQESSPLLVCLTARQDPAISSPSMRAIWSLQMDSMSLSDTHWEPPFFFPTAVKSFLGVKLSVIMSDHLSSLNSSFILSPQTLPRPLIHPLHLL